MLHMKQLNSEKKKRFPRFDKILVIQPITEVYGKGNERQFCLEIGAEREGWRTCSEIFSIFEFYVWIL